MTRGDMMGSPAYIFDQDAFSDRCRKAGDILGGIPLTFSMKANPFLLDRIPESISHVEVCSPGELEICMKMQIPPERIIYSGVMKEAWDVEKAVAYGVDLLTAESLLHVKLESEAVCRLRTSEKETRKVILRLTSGNQFGMSEEDIDNIIGHQDRYPGLEFYGIHYYSGTQKKQRQIRKDFQRLEKLMARLSDKYDYTPRLVEYGPGASVEYFEGDMDQADWSAFSQAAEEIRAFARKYPVGVEMGRFLACDCGHFLTGIKDMKVNTETNYLIVDGGIHQLRYYGQSLAVQIPPMNVIGKEEEVTLEYRPAEGETVTYMVCGSLCTTGDVLVREVKLPRVDIGDYLIFHRCGAYSVTEGTALFLSRTLPRIYLWSKEQGLKLARDFRGSYELNLAEVLA